MISFPSNSTLIEIEDAYSTLQGDGANEIRIPTHLRHGGTFGIIAALIQFITFWARSNPDGALIPYSSGSGLAAFAELLRQPHGFVAGYMAPRLVDPKHVKVNRNEVLATALNVIEAMQQIDRLRETMNGRGVFLTCFAGAKNEYLLPFYERPEPQGLRGTRDFANLTQQIVSACAPELIRHASKESIEAIGLLLRELFENTNDHARTDELGREYDWKRPNVRGVLAKFISFGSYEEAASAFRGDGSHTLFFNRAILGKPVTRGTQLKAKTSETRNFLELSVFDGGPGIARRWLAHKQAGRDLESLSIQEEEALVRETFELGKTSKQGNGTGVGLDSVCKSMLELKALLRLRTGRLCLYQDFSHGTSSMFNPSHWLNDRKELAPTTGSVFSILIPLPSKART